LAGPEINQNGNPHNSRQDARMFKSSSPASCRAAPLRREAP
jgi:hypothetical protein